MLRSLQSALQGGSIMGSRIRARVLKTACKASGCRPPIHRTSQNHGLSIRTVGLNGFAVGAKLATRASELRLFSLGPAPSRRRARTKGDLDDAAALVDE